MCGICGMVGHVDAGIVERISQSLIHRGPDDHGIWSDGKACFGHRRLSVIDTSSSGRQPMSNEDGEIWITYNGEIYNFKSLRTGLEASGHKFRSNTDTEVIIHLYEEHAEECLKYLRGMFSFAIWDSKRGRLFAARDRLGIKPFFYFHSGERFIFSSELKTILASGVVKKELNSKSVTDYFTYGSVQAPDTIIKGVVQLLPGRYLFFESGALTIREYWKIHVTEAHLPVKPETEYTEEIRAILTEAVKIRMVSDVPMGAFLSGGIDSSAVVALMQKGSNLPVRTFSVVFNEKRYDERAFSDMAAEKFGTDHTQILIQEKEILQGMPVVFDAMDQPSIDGFNTFFISKAVRRAGITVALSGLGGDELFAGYRLFKTLPVANRTIALWRHLPGKARAGLFNCVASHIKDRFGLKAIFSALRCSDIDSLYRVQRSVFLPHEVKEIVSQDAYRPENGDLQEYGANSDAINRLSFLELTAYLRNTLLQDTDRMSMANSLEVRVPFLDHILVEKMFEIPGRMKVGGGCAKRLLTRSVMDILPDDILKRPKMGFVFPFDQWFRNELRGYCSEKLSCENIKKVGVLEQKTVDKVYRDFLGGSKLYNYSSVLALLSFVVWYENNILK